MKPNTSRVNLSNIWSSVDQGLSVHYFKYSHNYYCLGHVHGEFSINIPLDHPLSYQIGDKVETVLPGSALVIQPGEWHAGKELPHGVTISVSERTLKSLCCADQSSLFLSHGSVSFTRLVNDSRLHSLGQELANEIRNTSIGKDIVIVSLVNQCLVYLLRGWAVPTREAAISNRCLRAIEMVRAVECMNDCPKSSFSLQSLAAAIGTSQSRFITLFSASTSSSPLAFYNHILIQKAQQMLLESDMAIKEVAFTLEFRNESHFCNLFRAISGTSPTAFRTAALQVSHPKPARLPARNSKTRDAGPRAEQPLTMARSNARLNRRPW